MLNDKILNKRILICGGRFIRPKIKMYKLSQVNLILDKTVYRFLKRGIINELHF